MKGKIFNTQEVQSILSGSKVMFREVIKPYPILSEDKSYWEFKGVRWAGENSSYAKNFGDNARPEMPDLCPYKVGQKIFCKESFWEYKRFGDEFRYDYDADTDYTKCLPDGFPIQRIPLGAWEVKKRPAQHMKQEHSRLTLLIKEIKVERLWDISVEDCWEEGVTYSPECCENYVAVPDCNGNPTPSCCNNPNLADPRGDFKAIWNATHKKPEEKFEANPWVWVVDFIKTNRG